MNVAAFFHSLIRSAPSLSQAATAKTPRAKRDRHPGVTELLQALESRTLPAIMAPLGDTTPPHAVNSFYHDGYAYVTFSEDMATTGAGSVLNKANFRITSNGVNVISPTGNIIYDGLNTATNEYDVRIPASAPIDGELYAIFATGNLRDLAGNQLDGNQDGTPGDDYYGWVQQASPHPGDEAMNFGPYDTFFGNSSFASTTFFDKNPSEGFANDVVYDSAADKFYTVGQTIDPVSLRSSFALIRYGSDLSVDTSFGTNGRAIVNFSNDYNAAATRVVVDSVFGILVAGWTKDPSGATQRTGFAVARYDFQGNLVSSFGTGGKVTLFYGSDSATVRDIAIDRLSERLIIAGQTSGQQDKGIVTALSLTNGQVDATFNSTGTKDLSSSHWTDVTSVILQSDGSMFLSGKVDLGIVSGVQQYAAAAARLKFDGTLDQTFGLNGTRTLQTQYANGGALEMVLRDNRLLILNTENIARKSQTEGEQTRAALFRLQLDGSLDTSFGNQGIVPLDPFEGTLTDFDIDSGGVFYFSAEVSQRRSSPTYAEWNEGRIYFSPLTLDINGTLASHQLDYSRGGLAASAGFRTLFFRSDDHLIAGGYQLNDVVDDYGFLTMNFQPVAGADVAKTNVNGPLTPFPNAGEGLALQPDGKLITVGQTFDGTDSDITVTRTLPDGSLDLNFGIEGRVKWDVAEGSDDYARAVAIQADGKIVIVGNTVNNSVSRPFIIRMDSSGSVTSNIIPFALGSSISEANDVLVHPNGNVYIVGKYQNNTAPSQGMILCLNGTDLTLRTSFGTNGMRTFSLGDGHDVATSITRDPYSNNLVVAGWSYNAGRQYTALARFDRDNGSFDTTFSNDGSMLILFGTDNSSAVDVLVNDNNQILVLAKSIVGNTDGTAVACYTSDGLLVSGFGPGGSGIMRTERLSPRQFLIQADNKIVIAGSVGGKFATLRLTRNGTSDSTYGDGAGFATYYFGGVLGNIATGIVQLPDGRIALEGTTGFTAAPDTDVSDSVILMIEADGPPTVTYVDHGVAAVGNPQMVDLSVADPAPADRDGHFMFHFDWNNDGIFDEHLEGTRGATFYHTFTSTGLQTFRISASDKDYVTGDTISVTINIPNNIAPVLDPAGNPTLDTIPAEVTDANNPGLRIADLITRMAPGGITNADPNSNQDIGIAIIGADMAYGTWQWTNNGSQWVDFEPVSANHALLLASTSFTAIRFVPQPNFSGTASITFRAWDLSDAAFSHTYKAIPATGGTTAFSTASETASITVTSDNLAPLLNNTGNPVLTTIAEDVANANNQGTLISQIIASMSPNGSITDPNPGAKQGIAITVPDQTNGTWQFTTNNGTTWTNFGTLSVSNALLLASDANTRVRFLPNADFNGTSKFVYVAWDQSAGTNGSTMTATARGGSKPFSTDFDTAILTITPTNDAPVLGGTTTVALQGIVEDTPAASLFGTAITQLLTDFTSNFGTYTDVDAGALKGIAVTSVDNTNGTWEYTTNAGTTWLPFGTPSAANARLLASVGGTRLRFLPKPNFDGLPTFNFVAWDRTEGTNGGTAVATNRGGIKPFSLAVITGMQVIESVNDAPVLNNAGNPTLTPINANVPNTSNPGTLVSQIVASMAPNGGITDADPNAAKGIAIIGANQTNGTWQFSLNGTTWFDFGTSTGLSSALLLSSDATTRLRFIPKANFSGTSGISFVAWDRTDGSNSGTRANITASGGSTSFSTSTETALITINPVNTPAAIGIFRNGQFFLDANNNGTWNSTADSFFAFGNPTDTPLVGDWNGDGKSDIGVWRNGTFYLDLNGNRKWDATDTFFTFGNPTDKPITGDWNGDGKTDIGTFRSGTFFLDANGSRKWEGASDVSFNFGNPTDIPITGDWNGDGKSDIGTFRSGTFFLDANGSRKWESANDVAFLFGNPTDLPVTGDWNADGKTDVGTFRNGSFFLDYNGSRKWEGASDKVYNFGIASDKPLAGTWPAPTAPASLVVTNTSSENTPATQNSRDSTRASATDSSIAKIKTHMLKTLKRAWNKGKSF